MSTIIHVSDHRAGVAYMQAECGGCQAVGPRVECGLKYDPDAAALARQHAAGEDPYLATNTARSIRKKRKTGCVCGKNVRWWH